MNKFRAETDKHNTLLDELLQVRENLRLTKEKFEETNKNLESQAADIKELTETISAKLSTVNTLSSVVEEQRKVNTFESEKQKKFMKANAALKAKLEFIESKYDYSSMAKQMSMQDFKDLIESNLHVNNTIGGFTGKLEGIQKEIQNIEAMRNMII